MNKDRVEKLGESIADLSKNYKISKDALVNLASGIEQFGKGMIDKQTDKEYQQKYGEIERLKSECDKLYSQLMETEKSSQEKISELESKLSKSHSEIQEWHDEAIAIRNNRDEMLANFRKGIEPYVDLQDMHDKISELQDRHQQDCITINQLNVTIDVLVDKLSRLRQQMGL